ncbi:MULTISPECIES: hypothetical protein [Halomonadaceae]|uniref:hypothetical protein n=1 Tax=Halomonadaceae TaxID=28256 RepID=UPI003CF2BED2
MASTKTAQHIRKRKKRSYWSALKALPRRGVQRVIAIAQHWDRFAILMLGSLPLVPVMAWPSAVTLLPAPWPFTETAGWWASLVITSIFLYPLPVWLSVKGLWRRRWRDKRTLHAWSLLAWLSPLTVAVVISAGYTCAWQFQC